MGSRAGVFVVFRILGHYKIQEHGKWDLQGRIMVSLRNLGVVASDAALLELTDKNPAVIHSNDGVRGTMDNRQRQRGKRINPVATRPIGKYLGNLFGRAAV
jgi:hypothetical protein